MNDCTGKKINIGDIILYLNGHGGRKHCSFHPAIVTKINKVSIRAVCVRYGTARNELLRRSEKQLFILDDIPESLGAFKHEIADISRFCIENEKLPEEIMEKCLYHLG